MRNEIKTAAIVAIVIVIALGGIGYYFTTLDKPKEISLQNPASDNKQTSNAATSIGTKTVPQVDESQYPLAPDLVGISGYVNTTPEDLKAAMKDKVVLYDFWTYSCINCIRTFPYLKAWNEKYSDKGLLIVGVHSPEFEFEKDINNVKMAVAKYGLKYPTVLDNDHSTWDAFGNRYWPAEYLTDSLGHIRHTHFGEGAYDETEKVIQQLLDERSQRLGLNVTADQSLVNIQEHQFANQQTPELYFGYNFATGRDFLGNSEGFKPDGTVSYSLPSNLSQDHFYLEGQWQNLPDSMKLVSQTGKIVLPYFAKDVHIVAANKADLQIMLDGNPISSSNAGADVQNGIIHVSENRLYNVVSSSTAGSHTLTIAAQPGFQIYTFTFG
ncbi:MAG: redoxin domain-containing protein [Thaumarchaeota archaeon]|nr:redoxin domain-containing protein [Nitrososphaerota archaeon]